MKVHFREQYGTKGEEILYITPAGKQTNIYIIIYYNIYMDGRSPLMFSRGISFVSVCYPAAKLFYCTYVCITSTSAKYIQ